VRLEKAVLVLGARLDLAPVAFEHVLAGIDHAPCVSDGPPIELVGRHRPSMAAPASSACSAPRADAVRRARPYEQVR
jgi:hypothetical protein